MGLIDGILHWLFEPSAQLMHECDPFVDGWFVTMKYPRRYRYCVYAVLRLWSYRWMYSMCWDDYRWHRAYLVWCSEDGFDIRWRSQNQVK